MGCKAPTTLQIYSFIFNYKQNALKMDLKDFQELCKSKEAEFEELARREFPVKVANMAQTHYRKNFDRGGFLNNGHHPWKITKRQLSGRTDAGAKYGPLLSERKHLRDSVVGTSTNYRAKVSNNVHYAAIHNFGGVIKRPRKPKKEKAKKKKGLASLALPTPTGPVQITIPQRQFIGRSAELETDLRNKLDKDIETILNK